jgi:hypothetical protein
MKMSNPNVVTQGQIQPGQVVQAQSPNGQVQVGQPTQGGLLSDQQLAQIPGVSTQITFGQQAVDRLRPSDFALDTPSKIGLRNRKECLLVLFYTENIESRRLIPIWAEAALQVAGPTFGALNLLNDRDVASAFTSLQSDPNNPFHWAGLQGIPFILVYRDGWPVAVYNGERAVQPIVDYALTLACQASYREQVQLAGGVQVDPDRNIGMSGWTEFQPRRTSLDYTSDRPTRGYRSDLPNFIVGSEGERQVAANQEQFRQAQEAQEATGRVAPGTNPGARPASDIANVGTLAGQREQVDVNNLAGRGQVGNELGELQRSAQASQGNVGEVANPLNAPLPTNGPPSPTLVPLNNQRNISSAATGQVPGTT